MEPKMQFVLTGFTPDKGFRVFAFERIDADKSRTGFTVKTDMSLVQRYGIPVQELPLLCRRLLERRDEGEAEHSFIFSEEDMSSFADGRTAERNEILRKKSLRRPPTTKPTNPGFVNDLATQATKPDQETR